MSTVRSLIKAMTVLVGLMMALSPEPGRGQGPETFPLHLRRLSDRVLVVWPGDHAQTTTMIAMATEKGLVVVDTESSWTVTGRIREVIAREFRRNDFAFLINTHGHGDHGGGNQVFRDAVIVAHERSPDLLRENLGGASLPGAISLRRSWVEGLNEQIASTKAGDPGLEALEEQGAYHRQVVSDLESGFELTLPTVTFSENLTLDMGDLTLRLFYFGGLHTRDQIVVHVPEEELLLTGDILFDEWIPLVPDGVGLDIPLMLANWERLPEGEGAVEGIVPGHRDLPLSLHHFRRSEEYVRSLWEEVGLALSQGLDLQAARQRLSLDRVFPEFLGLTWEADGTDYHRKNIDLLWSLREAQEARLSSEASGSHR